MLQSLPAHVNVMGLRDVFRSSSGRVYFVFELFERSLLQVTWRMGRAAGLARYRVVELDVVLAVAGQHVPLPVEL